MTHQNTKEDLERSKVVSIESLLKGIETISKIVVFFVGWSYGIGLLILNIHLGTYSFSYLGFVEVQYILVGLLWSVITYLTSWAMLGFGLGIRSTVQEKSDDRPTTIKIRKALFPLMLTIAFYFVLLYSISSPPTISKLFSKEYLSAVVSMTLNAFLVVQAFQNIIVELKISDGLSIQNIISLTRIFSRDFFVLLVILLSYSNLVFPLLPSAYGGGRKFNVEIVVKQDKIETIRQFGLDVIPNTRKVGPLTVILETPEYVLVSTPKEYNGRYIKAVKIQKDIMDAVLYIDTIEEP